MLSASTRAFFSWVILSSKIKLSYLRAFSSVLIASLSLLSASTRASVSLSIAVLLASILSPSLLSASSRAFFSWVICSPKCNSATVRAFLSCVIASLRSFTSLSIAFWLAEIFSAFLAMFALLVSMFALLVSTSVFTLTKSFWLAKAVSFSNTVLVFTSWPKPTFVPEYTLTPSLISAACALLATKPTPPNTKLSATAFANIFFIDNTFFSPKF